MPDFPRFQESQPILNPVKINDTSSGDEDIAKVLGSISTVSAQKTVEIEEEKSSAMLINSVSNLEQIKTTSEMRLLEHPDQANKIAEDTQSAIDLIKKAAFVNEGDRTKLNSYASSAQNSVDLKATATSLKQSQLEAAYTHYANWPDQLNAYKQALLTDHDKAEELRGAMQQTLKGLVMTGSLTPEQAGSGFKSMDKMVEIAQDHYDLYGNKNATAKDYHTVTSNPLGSNSNHNTKAPIDQSTQWMIDYHSNDKSFQGVMADISNKVLPNPEVFDSLKPAQRQRAIMAMQGVREADGMINAGVPFPVIEKTLESLTEGGRVLDYKEQSKRNYLKNYVGELKNGNYLNVIGRTPAGGSIMQNFVARNTAIQNTAIDDKQKLRMLSDNQNEMVNQAVSYGESHHIPKEYIQPIPSVDMINVQNGFKLGQDPSLVLVGMNKYTKQNQTYVANGLEKPAQRIMVQALSYTGDKIKQQDKLDFIAANQEGRTFDALDFEKNNVKKENLNNRIANNLSDQLSFITKQYDFESGQQLQSSMISSTYKYAQYLAQKNNDLTLSYWKDYVDQASQIYANAFKKQTGTNYIVNENQLPVPLSKPELDVLANYATEEGYKYLKNGVDPSSFESARSRNPLFMIISPTNDIQAVDGNGKVYFTTPFTMNLVSHAQEELRKRKNEEIKMTEKPYENVYTDKLKINLYPD